MFANAVCAFARTVTHGPDTGPWLNVGWLNVGDSILRQAALIDAIRAASQARCGPTNQELT